MAILLSGVLAFEARAVEELPQPVTIGSTVPLEKATDFKAQPLAILAQFPTAGTKLAHFVAQLIAQEPQAADAVLSIINDTTPEQASAISAGFVRAARVLLRKNPEFVQLLSDKISRSENIWLKTTFLAIGPRSNPYAAFHAPGNLPPRAMMNLASGTELPPTKGRLGEEKETLLTLPSTTDGFRRVAAIGSPFHDDGMIVAIVASDALANGAVSTSPTN